MAEGLGHNLFSLHIAQLRHHIDLLPGGGVSMFDGALLFPWRRSGSYLIATRMPPEYEGLQAAPAVHPTPQYHPRVQCSPSECNAPGYRFPARRSWRCAFACRIPARCSWCRGRAFKCQIPARLSRRSFFRCWYSARLSRHSSSGS